MFIPIRVVAYQSLNKKVKFSIWEGLKTLWYNLSHLFTHRLLFSCTGWYEEKEEKKIVYDYAIYVKDGKMEFVETPSGKHTMGIEISQNVDE